MLYQRVFTSEEEQQRRWVYEQLEAMATGGRGAISQVGDAGRRGARRLAWGTRGALWTPRDAGSGRCSDHFPYAGRVTSATAARKGGRRGFDPVCGPADLEGWPRIQGV